MTMIGFATYADHAEFITDSTWYTKYVEQLGVATKHTTINHLDAAVLTQGDSRFGELAKSAARQMACAVTSFDELVAGAPKWLDEMLDETGRPDPATVFLIGWSEEAQAFRAYVCASEQDFKPLKVNQFITPAPWTIRPSGLELRRTRAYVATAHESRQALWPQVEDIWTRQRPMTPPASTEEWVALAKLTRSQRCVDDKFAQVLVAGQVFHTRLGRGEVATRRVHDFATDGEELLTMVRNTRHPLGQMQECWCESGKAFRDCHLRCAWEEPCGCGSGETFEVCCMVPTAQDDAVREVMAQVGTGTLSF